MTPFCRFCRHFTAYRDEAVGTCAKGGPDAGDGCSDVGAEETCSKWAAPDPGPPVVRPWSLGDGPGNAFGPLNRQPPGQKGYFE